MRGKDLSSDRLSVAQDENHGRRVFSVWVGFSVWFVFLLTLVFALISVRLEAVEERWIYFSYDINLAGVKYYYDSHTITRLSEDKVSVWLKIASSYEERLLQTEISCPSGMFRIVEGPGNVWGNKSKISSVARGWVVIFPNSEVYLLSKIVCKKGDIPK